MTFPPALSRRLPHPAVRLLALLALLLLVVPARATHIRAGDIQAVADRTNLLRYVFTLRLYTDDRSPIDEPVANICFGDGVAAQIQRLSKTPLNTCSEVSENVYVFAHVFPAPGQYTIAYLGNNRNSTILNLGPSPTDLGIYISTTILIDATTGINNSAVFNQKPVDGGAINQVFTHAPGASDIDLDSLSFSFVTPRQGRLGAEVCDPPADITTYQALDQFSNAPHIFRIDQQTGLITWDSPNICGEFNVAYVAHEWRYLGEGIYREVGAVVRDMQITIVCGTNHPPVLNLPPDTCVVANTTFTQQISATDPDGQPVTLAAVGAPFTTTPPATLVNVTANPRVARFTWTPDCNQVARQPYLATFTAKDVVPNCEAPLSRVAVWRVRVVGPKPQNLTATAESVRQIRLRWSWYECHGIADSIRIYRKIDSTDFEPSTCETGIPKGLGYTYVGSVTASDTTFLDLNGGKRFKRGATYCYRIYATWPLPKGGESLASDQACAMVQGLLPMLTNATVDVTAPAAGQVTVRWTKGDPGPQPGTFTNYYRLSRADDSTTTYTVLRDHIPLTDTVLLDPNLNTLRRQYRYRLEFVNEDLNGGQLTTIDTVDQATTARLSGQINAAARQVDLTWIYDVPWDNTPRTHYIYRRINGALTLIDSVAATATGGAYSDRFTFGGIPFGRDTEYRYQVLTRGTYRVGTRQTDSTENFSQEVIIKLLPCPPTLQLDAPDCVAEAQTCPAELFNQLRWRPDLSPNCAPDIAFYHVYFRPTAEGDFTLLATTPDTAYRHGPLTTRAGCYAVTAVDSSGNESEKSNIVCQENCLLFALPNIITPDADGLNDRFVPLCASAVRKVTFRVFNRWGRKVYESASDPQINWPGTDTGGKRLSDGTYFYQAEVEFDQLQPTTRTFKGWVEIAASRGQGSGSR